jgi:tetraacyldisaccharide 4'-kinase
VRDWLKKPILAYAGIGRPQKFFASLEAIQAPVAATRGFPDHYRYTEADAERLLAHADAAGLRLVTTEKDMARLAGATGPVGNLRDRSDAFAVSLEFENAVAVAEMITDVARNAEIVGR